MIEKKPEFKKKARNDPQKVYGKTFQKNRILLELKGLLIGTPTNDRRNRNLIK